MMLSAIVPVYNVSNLLVGGVLPCFETLLSQEGSVDVEIIAVDDCSPDDSYQKVLRAYENRYPERFVALQTPENLRAGGARNLGLRHAQGDWITFVDQDDYVDSGFASKLILAGEFSEADMVGCFWNITETTDGSIGRVQEVPWQKQVGKLTSQRRKALLVESGGLLSKIYRKRVLELASHGGGLFPEKLAYEDNAVINSILMSAESYAFVPEALYNYHVHGESVTHTLSHVMMEDRFSAETLSLNYAREDGYLDEFKEELEYIAATRMYINTVRMILQSGWSNREKSDFLLRVRNALTDEFPHYSKNRYYRAKVGKRQKLFASLHGLCPRIMSDLMTRFK